MRKKKQQKTKSECRSCERVSIFSQHISMLPAFRRIELLYIYNNNMEAIYALVGRYLTLMETTIKSVTKRQRPCLKNTPTTQEPSYKGKSEDEDPVLRGHLRGLRYLEAYFKGEDHAAGSEGTYSGHLNKESCGCARKSPSQRPFTRAAK